ncbi:MAG: hypothetical protein AB2669_06460 [Candidatus Thiodiazotropha endolucinida]
MNSKTLILATLLIVPAWSFAEDAWGPELIQFDLEGGKKIETMLWISGFSYSSTEFLRSTGCFKTKEYIGSKELIIALNGVYKEKKITSELATEVLGKYVRSNYPCAAYNQQRNTDSGADAPPPVR